LLTAFYKKVDGKDYKAGNLVVNTKDFSNVIAKIEGQKKLRYYQARF